MHKMEAYNPHKILFFLRLFYVIGSIVQYKMHIMHTAV